MEPGLALQRCNNSRVMMTTATFCPMATIWKDSIICPRFTQLQSGRVATGICEQLAQVSKHHNSTYWKVKPHRGASVLCQQTSFLLSSIKA